jgi:hypothetical protein
MSTTPHLLLATELNEFERNRNAKFVLGRNSGDESAVTFAPSGSNGFCIYGQCRVLLLQHLPSFSTLSLSGLGFMLSIHVTYGP